MQKASKGIGVIKRIQKNLPGNIVPIIYKSFIRPHVDHGDIVYGRPDTESFISKLQQFQYNAGVTVTEAIDVIQAF